jgi:hypothetical protein
MEEKKLTTLHQITAFNVLRFLDCFLDTLLARPSGVGCKFEGVTNTKKSIRSRAKEKAKTALFQQNRYCCTKPQKGHRIAWNIGESIPNARDVLEFACVFQMPLESSLVVFGLAMPCHVTSNVWMIIFQHFCNDKDILCGETFHGLKQLCGTVILFPGHKRHHCIHHDFKKEMWGGKKKE